MSKQQGLRRCASSTNMDTIRCSSYTPKLVPPPSRCSPLCSSRLSRQTSTAPKSKVVVPQRGVNKPEVIRKQINADEGALVEVRVRRPKPKVEASESGKWEELLKPNSRGAAISSFQNFDPLRTLHFLIQELHTRLQGQLPNDTSLLQIILDMQLALNRVPQEVVTAANLQSLRFDEFTNRQKYNKPFMLNKGSQTKPTENYVDIIEVNKQLESNITKLESSCKQMEGLCCQLKDEKDALEIRLLGEGETVRFLQNKIHHLETSLNEKSSNNSKLAQLKRERDDLQAKLTNLRAELKSMTKSNQSKELYRVVQELQSQKQSAEHQCADLRHKLASLTIENEKYATTLLIRDHDLGEIRREMDQLQEIVNQQLVEMQKQSTLGSEVTSGSSPPTDEQWYRDVLTKVGGDNFTLSSIHTSSSTGNNQDAPTSDEIVPDFLRPFTH